MEKKNLLNESILKLALDDIKLQLRELKMSSSISSESALYGFLVAAEMSLEFAKSHVCELLKENEL